VGGIAIGGAFVAGIAFGYPAAAIAAAVFVALAVAGRISTVLTVAVVAAALIGTVRAVPWPDTRPPAWLDDATAFRGIVESGPLSSASGQHFDVQLDDVKIGPEWKESTLRVCVTAPSRPRLGRGDRVVIDGFAVSPQDLRPSQGKAVVARGCAGSVTAWRLTITRAGSGWRHAVDGVRQSAVRSLENAVPGDTGALLAGLVTGDDGALSEERRADFVATGTSHITAVSGSNVALVLTVLVTFGGWAGITRRLPWQVVTIAFVWSYALLVGLGPPVLRAAIVATAAVLAVRFGRRPDVVTLTVLAAAVQLAYRPADYWTLSFRLSFAAALALALVLRGLDPGSFRSWVGASVVGSTAAQLATAGLTFTAFDRMSPVGLPANIAIGPAVAIAFPFAALAALTAPISTTLSRAIEVPAALAGGYVVWVVGLLGDGMGPVNAGRTSTWATACVLIVGIAGIVALSGDCRLALRRAGRAIGTPDPTAIGLAVAVGLGLATGVALALALR
jgi:ComEC/Rec2-related protein